MAITRTQSQIWGRRLVFILIGVFALIIAVNAVMITLALKTFSGVPKVNSYEQGLAYNQTLEAKHKQDALGWTVVRVKERFPATLSYMMADKSGAPLTGASVVAQIMRPVNNEPPFVLALTETQPGVYDAAVAWPGKGAWQIVTGVRHGDDSFSMEERVVVR